MTPTNEQLAILKAATDSSASLMINAMAGTGKTSTLVMLAEKISGPALALAFNVKIKKELEKRFPSNFTVLTMNGLGHRAWGKIVGRAELDANKLGKIISDLLKEFKKSTGENPPPDWWADIRQLVSAAQSVGLTPREMKDIKGLMIDTDANWSNLADDLFIEPREEIIALAREALMRDIKQACGQGGKTVISFDDQIYMSTLFGGAFTKFPLVMVDESQDLSPLQHEMLRRSASNRLIVVGDPRQSIYMFRGADHLSMEKLRGLRESWIDLPLTQTFRCPKSIVERQLEHAPGYRAAEANAQGEIVEIAEGWSFEDLSFRPDIAILCRNNGPLIAMAFKLIRQRIPVVMLGRDIGKNLVALSRKIIPDDKLGREGCAVAICKWEQHEIQIARERENESKIAGIEDRAACLMAVLEFVENAGELRAALDDLFGRDVGRVTLSSIHRSKGLEWKTVVHLDPWRIPSKFAKKAAQNGDKRQLQQEYNLRYVCETRAQQTLILANMEQFQ
jgi:superfamily I DNA/RNA helicase